MGEPREDAARHFYRDLVADADYLRRTIGYNPTRFQQMPGELGGVKTARRLLLHGSHTSDGFTTLSEARQLGRSVETFVLLPWYQGLFADDERSAARQRLEDHDFDVDAYLGHRAVDPPAWVQTDGREPDA